MQGLGVDWLRLRLWSLGRMAHRPFWVKRRRTHLGSSPDERQQWRGTIPFLETQIRGLSMADVTPDLRRDEEDIFNGVSLPFEGDWDFSIIIQVPALKNASNFPSVSQKPLYSIEPDSCQA